MRGDGKASLATEATAAERTKPLAGFPARGLVGANELAPDSRSRRAFANRLEDLVMRVVQIHRDSAVRTFGPQKRPAPSRGAHGTPRAPRVKMDSRDQRFAGLYPAGISNFEASTAPVLIDTSSVLTVIKEMSPPGIVGAGIV